MEYIWFMMGAEAILVIIAVSYIHVQFDAFYHFQTSYDPNILISNISNNMPPSSLPLPLFLHFFLQSFAG